jgi:Transcription factor WhiB
VPQPRRALRLDPHDYSLQLSGLPDLRRLFGEPWHLEAACKDETDELLFFQEVSPFKLEEPQAMASPSLLLPLLVCETCPVRRPCLRAALDPPTFTTREDEHHAVGAHESKPRVFGTWGGTHEGDRYKVAHVGIDDAIEELERTFPERLAARLDAYWASRRRLRPDRHRPGAVRTRMLTRRDRRIDELLAKREVKTSHRLGPGPGRGHKGPIALYAERHGVSRSTAWRKLRAA